MAKVIRWVMLAAHVLGRILRLMSIERTKTHNGTRKSSEPFENAAKSLDWTRKEKQNVQ